MGLAAAAVPGSSQSSSQVSADTETRVPVINLKDGTRLAGDDAPMRKDLELWLKEHPGFVADTGAFIPVSFIYFHLFKRHRLLMVIKTFFLTFSFLGGK